MPPLLLTAHISQAICGTVVGECEPEEGSGMPVARASDAG